jgi:uncharacterized protein YicC (UPF0701 family)
MTNTNAVVSDNASADASAMTEDTQETMANAITKLFDDALRQLVTSRDERYSDAIKELDDEASTMAREYEQLENDIKASEDVLPSKERLIQRQVDELVVNGDPAAKEKFAELAEFKRKPAVMRERLSVIQDRFQSIDQEKCDIAKRIFEEWYSELQPVVRSAEHGLLITLLNGLAESFYQYQTRTGTGTSDNRHRPLLNQGHITGLTADGRSAEYAAGRHWYR